MTAIVFARPELAVPSAAAVICAAGIGAFWMRRRRRVVSFYGPGGGRIHGPLRVGSYVVCFVLLGALTGLLVCGPHARKRVSRDVFEPLDIVLAIDISRSMLVEAGTEPEGPGHRACPPARLDVASREVLSFIDQLRRSSAGRAALVVFARYAYSAIPVLTDDFALFTRRFGKEMLLENVLTMAEGTNHWAAVVRALAIFEPGARHKRILVLLTDGEPSAPEGELAASRSAALQSLGQRVPVEIYVVGIGRPGLRQAVPAAWRRDGCPDGEMGHMVQVEGPGAGRVMTTVTDPAALRSLARQLSGRYLHSATGADLSKRLRGLIEAERVKTGVRFVTASVDLSGYLIAALLLVQAVMVVLKTP